MDENAHYFLLVFLWLSSAPVYLAPLPYCGTLFPKIIIKVFSLYHSVNYIKTQILPLVYAPLFLSKGIHTFTSSTQSQALTTIAYIEVLLLPPLLIFNLLRSGSVFSLIVYFNFLRFKYSFSEATRAAVTYTKEQVDRGVGKGPEMLKGVYGKVVAFISSMDVRQSAVEKNQ